MDHFHSRYSQSTVQPDTKISKHRVRHVANIDHFHSQSLVHTDTNFPQTWVRRVANMDRSYSQSMIDFDTNMDQLHSDYKLNAG